jgi:spore coat polysaccharide biosynthesis predicted glycosyltransferase SpsG
LNILFITNYEKKYGIGHLNRCNKLAKKIKKGNKIFFLVDKIDKNLPRLIIKNSKIITKKNIFNSGDKIFKIIKNLKNPIVIIDSYLSNLKFEKKISPYCKKLIVIDDLKKKHFCDIYINPNFLNFKFASKITANMKLLGPKYAFIDPNIKKKNNKKIKSNTIKNILVFMGATDSRNLSVKIYNALKDKNITKLNFKFIIGCNNDSLENIKKENELKNVRFQVFSKNFTKHLNKADIFISSGGSSIWESIFLNKKTLIFNHSWKQFENSFNLEKKGIIKVFKKKLKSQKIIDFLITEIDSSNKDIFKYNNLIDSKGIDRIVKKISK